MAATMAISWEARGSFGSQLCMAALASELYKPNLRFLTSVVLWYTYVDIDT